MHVWPRQSTTAENSFRQAEVDISRKNTSHRKRLISIMLLTLGVLSCASPLYAQQESGNAGAKVKPPDPASTPGGEKPSAPAPTDTLPMPTDMPVDFQIPESKDKKASNPAPLWRHFPDGLSTTLGTGIPLNYADEQLGSDREGSASTSTPTYFLSLKYSPISYWYVGTTLIGYLNSDKQQSWNPDFTYCFGYSDWHADSFGASYCNYGGNRFDPGPGESHTDFKAGSWTFNYKFEVAELIKNHILIDKTKNIACNLSYSFTRSHYDSESSSTKGYKDKILAGCNYPIWGYWYANLVLHQYLHPGQKQPWDPDYTYGFGYFDWHPGTFSVQYNNYAGNRYPWSSRQSGNGTFRDGTVTISWHTNF